MNQTTQVLGSGVADLLAIPALLLEFQPEESIVAICMRGNAVQFCARADLGLTDEQLADTVDQLLNGFHHKCGREFLLLGFGCDVARVRDGLVAMQASLGGTVTVMIASNHERFWQLEDGNLPAHDGEPYTIAESPVVAQAVFGGVQIGRTRAEAVAVVRRPPAHLRAEISTRLEAAFERVLPLDPDERLQLFGQLLEQAHPLLPDAAAELAALLQIPECHGEFVCQVGSASAQGFHARLLEARAACDEECEEGVLGPLALASWLAGKGAQMNECVAQLEEVGSRSPILRLVNQLLADTVPPTEWDRWAGR